MRRGTTVTNTFSGITYGPSDIQAIEQAGKIIAVTLSQADTLKFNQGQV